MAGRPFRLNVTLDEAHAVKLRRLAERAQVREGTLARSLLARALDETEAEPRHIAELLDRLPGAWEQAQMGLEQANSGDTVPLDEL